MEINGITQVTSPQVPVQPQYGGQANAAAVKDQKDGTEKVKGHHRGGYHGHGHHRGKGVEASGPNGTSASGPAQPKDEVTISDAARQLSLDQPAA